jgi:hypothetical protein
VYLHIGGFDTRVIFTIGLLAILVSVQAGSSSAKGVLDSIVLTTQGGGRLEITEGYELYEFNPWASRYLSGVVQDVPELGPSIEVALFADMTGDGPEQIYSFIYAPATGGGYIYIPGAGDPAYRRNITTVLSSPGGWENGAWHRASDEWIAFMASLGMIRPPSTGDGGLR